MAWPPDVPALKVDMRIDDTRDDIRLQVVLDAAVAYVQRVRKGDFNFEGDELSDLPSPPADLVLGTLRLARHYHLQRRSSDGQIDAGELGVSTVAGLDPYVQRLLRIGRHQKARIG